MTAFQLLNISMLTVSLWGSTEYVEYCLRCSLTDGSQSPTTGQIDIKFDVDIDSLQRMDSNIIGDPPKPSQYFPLYTRNIRM